MKIQNNYMKRLTVMVAGIILMGFGIALARIAELGTDPYTCMNLGLSTAFSMSFGTWQLIMNALLIIVIIIFKYIGIATLVNMVGIGYIADFFTSLLGSLFAQNIPFAIRLIWLSVAVIISGLSCAMYLAPDLGSSPYDSVAFILRGITKDKLPFRIARIISDVTCVAIGFAFGSIVGIGTVAMALLTGPLVQYFSKIIKKKLAL